MNPEKYLESYFRQMEVLSKSEENDELKLFFHVERAMDFNQIGLYHESLRNGEKALLLFYSNKHLRSQETSRHVMQIFAHLGNDYVHLNQFGKATSEYKKAIEFVKNYCNDSLLLASSINNYGIHLMENLKKVDSARLYFEKADSILLQLPDSLHYLRGSIRDNLANAYLDSYDYIKACSLFCENFKFYQPQTYIQYVPKTYQHPDYERWLRAGLQVAETELKLKNYILAQRALDRVDILLDNLEFNEKAELRLRYFIAYEKLNLAILDFDQAFYFRNIKNNLNDSIQRTKEAQQILWDHLLHEKVLSQVKSENVINMLLAENEVRNSRTNLLITIGILALSILTGAFFIILYRQRMNHSSQTKIIAEQKLKMASIKNELLEEQNESKKRDLSDFALYVAENQKWTKMLHTRFMHLSKLNGRAKGKELNDFEDIIKNKVLFNEATKSFKEKADKLSNDFYIRLRNQYPDLTNSETKLCSMIRLGSDNHEIAILFNIHQNSVHQSRYRLRKKLKLRHDQDLDIFLKTL